MTKEEIIKKLGDMAKYPTVTLPRDTEALRNAADLLEQAEPVATIGNWGKVIWAEDVYPQLGDKLYATPPQRKPLSDFEIKTVIASIDPAEQYLPNALKQFARAIEAAHGIKGEE